MVIATLNDILGTTILSCYSPTYASDKTDLIPFYNKLYYFVHSISKHNILIIGGDMNAQVGKNKSNKICLRNISKKRWGTSNRRGTSKKPNVP